MKKLLFFMVLGAAFLFSSCSVTSGLTANLNNNATEVVLSSNNYRIISEVQGDSHARYIFGIGGLTKKAMIAEARAKMLKNANLVGSSRAVIHETVEEKRTFYPFVCDYDVYVSGYVVEFNK